MTTSVRWLVVGDVCEEIDAKKSASRATPVNREVVLVRGETSPYDPSVVDSIVAAAVREAKLRIEELHTFDVLIQKPQLCIRPSLGGELRPSFGLSAESISALAEMEVSLDFDPY